MERRGAPVTAYARIDHQPLRVRTAITQPDIMVVLGPGLLRSTNVAYGLWPGGLVLLNSRRPPSVAAVGAQVRANWKRLLTAERETLVAPTPKGPALAAPAPSA